MATAKPKGKYTSDDYFATPEGDGEHWELIDGVLYHTTKTRGTRHQEVVGNFLFWICRHRWTRKFGELLLGPFAVVLSNRDVFEPDLLFITATRRHIISERACEGAPDLIAEILSRFQPAHTERDQFVKRELYARHGVPEYWILLPDAATVLALSKPVIRAGVGEYTSEHLYRVGDILTTTAIPGLVIPVAMIYADLRRRMKLR